jgi:PEP-CTERM motif-containing protein
MVKQVRLLVTAAIAVLMPLAAHANLITNGDFSAGNSNFTSDYNFVVSNGTVFTSPDEYGIATNPGTNYTNGYNSYGDHTTGTGNMLFVDGYAPSARFWVQSVTLAANTQYTFSFWATYAAPASFPNYPDIQVKLNGSAIDSGFTVTGIGAAGWQQVTDTFTTTSAGSYVLSMVDLNPNYQSGGDDFTVDDLSLNQVPEPASLALLGGALAALGLIRRRRKRAGRSRPAQRPHGIISTRPTALRLSI